MMVELSKKSKKVSIIIPAYNCESYIEKCLSSVLTQKGADLEIIVVNDGSKDRTLEILNGYKDKIRLCSIENSGAANARNVGLEKATGDFVMFLDSDDYLEENAIMTLIQKQQQYNADIIRFRYKKVFDSGKSFVPEYQPDFERFFPKSDFKKYVYPYFMNGIILNSICLSFFKAEIVSGLRLRKDMSVAEDAVFSLDAFTRADNALFLADVLYNYHTTSNSLTETGISVVKKYQDNYKFAFATIKKLKQWRMFDPYYIIKCLIRPVSLTFDKLKRIKTGKSSK